METQHFLQKNNSSEIFDSPLIDCSIESNWEENPDWIENLGNGIWDSGEYFIDGPTIISRDNCFKITRTLSMEMKGTEVIYNEKKPIAVVKLVKNNVYPISFLK